MTQHLFTKEHTIQFSTQHLSTFILALKFLEYFGETYGYDLTIFPTDTLEEDIILSMIVGILNGDPVPLDQIDYHDYKELLFVYERIIHSLENE